MEESGDKCDTTCINDELAKQNSSRPCSPSSSDCAASLIGTGLTRNFNEGTSAIHPRSNRNDRGETRRSTVKELIERYFYQLQRGCGNSFCTNVSCASSGLVTPMTPNEAAAKALQLFSQDAPFCDANIPPSKMPCSQASDQNTNSRLMSHHQNPELLALEPTQVHFNNIGQTSNSSSASTSGSDSRNFSITPSMTNIGTNNSRQSAGGMTNNSPQLNCLYDLGQVSPNCSPEIPRFINTGEIQGSENNSLTVNRRLPAFLYDLDSSPERRHPSKNSTEDPPTAKEDNGGESEDLRFPPVNFLNEKIVDELIEKGNKDGMYEHLMTAIADVYSCVNKLSQSFRHSSAFVLNQLTSSTNASKLQDLLGKSPCDLKKEDLRSLEGETEKDEDSTCNLTQTMDIEEAATSTTATSPFLVNVITGDLSMSEDSEDDEMVTVVASGSCKSSKEFAYLKDTSGMLVDLESLRRVKKKLFALNQPRIAETLNANIVLLSDTIKYQYNQWDWEKVLHCIIICFDMITNISNSLMDFEFLERSLPKLCQAVRIIPVVSQARLTRFWSVNCKDQLHSLVQCCQQLISLHVIMNDVAVQENSDVIAATKVLKIAYYASILAGQSDPPRNPILNDLKEESVSTSFPMMHDDEDELFFFNTEVPSSQYPSYADDNLAKELNLRAMYCRIPIVSFEEFYNEPLSDNIQMDRDYLCYKKLSLDPTGEDSNFSFMLYSFILTPATKVVGLYYDSRIRMYSERHTSIYSILSLYNGDGNEMNSNPDLKLKVRRDNIVNDALIGLELVAMSNPKDLKKQLVIEFTGEQGIDEGGVSKEFFQLIIEEIFNIDFGMFIALDETDTFWFNSMSFENDAQFTLVGIIIGLAIYNNIILAVRFPMVVYRKLMGAFGTFSDIKDFNPTVFRSLQSMLVYEDDDMEDVFMQTFKISYKNIFGDVINHELKPGGSNILVGQNNKQDFVDLYAEFLLNTSIERQFEAFKKGFEMVTDESPLRLLFRPEEIELLVCGSKKFDFVELEKSTDYEGGYTKDTQIVKAFWEIVHSMPEESKRKLLEFTTGSDRVPVGGLSRLKLLITRHGPDCDRLPTSHTCFNILLLPEYSSKDKLEERLLKAITYSKGFGML